MSKFRGVDSAFSRARGRTAALVRFYDRHRKAESGIKGGQRAISKTQVLCGDFADNQPRLRRFGLADNLGHFLRRSALPSTVTNGSPTTLRDKPIKIGATTIRRAGYVTFEMVKGVTGRTGSFRFRNGVA